MRESVRGCGVTPPLNTFPNSKLQNHGTRNMTTTYSQLLSIVTQNLYKQAQRTRRIRHGRKRGRSGSSGIRRVGSATSSDMCRVARSVQASGVDGAKFPDTV